MVTSDHSWLTQECDSKALEFDNQTFSNKRFLLQRGEFKRVGSLLLSQCCCNPTSNQSNSSCSNAYTNDAIWNGTIEGRRMLSLLFNSETIIKEKTIMIDCYLFWSCLQLLSSGSVPVSNRVRSTKETCNIEVQRLLCWNQILFKAWY